MANIMSEQQGKDPKLDFDTTRTLRIVRSDDDETLAAPLEAGADVGAAAGESLPEPPVEQTLPISVVQSASRQSGSRQSSAGPSAPGAAADQASPSGTRFRPLRPWREGGLGKVYIALDEELHREVALKEIKAQHAGNRNSQERFLIEGEVTGSLEHPGIVPVYGMGRYSDGRPYYAMRFVHGESLEEAIDRFHHRRPPVTVQTAPIIDSEAPTLDAADVAVQAPAHDKTTCRGRRTTDDESERSVAFRELLSRFIAVCNAMAYAHSRGVIHRDLKPGNILLAKYGETLVVDWGLAKVAGTTENLVTGGEETIIELQSGTGTAPTRFGAVIGTPAFMSPEQAEGRLDLLGPASDIYSLGATLYMLLTGRCAFMDPRLDVVLSNVRSGRFPRPRQVKPDVPKPLEAICLRAMALRREDRYETASALADDLQHWLADEPVFAYPERGIERALRWVRRHKAAALSTAIGLLLLATVSTGAAVLVNHLRVIADTARENENLAFRQARAAVDDLFTKVSEDSLLNQPGMQGLRRELLQKTLAYYQQFLGQRANDPSVKEEFAATKFRAGRIVDELQSPDKAVPILREARDLQAQLLSESPHDLKRLQALGDTQNALGRSLHRSQKFDEALVEYEKGRDLRQQLVRLAPQDEDRQRALANSVMNIGLVQKDQGQLDAAADQLQAAQQLREAQLAGGDSFKLQRDVAMGSYNQGVLELKRDNPNEAIKHFGSAIARLQLLQDRDPRDLSIQFVLATSLRLSADALSKDDTPAEAVQMYEQARDIFSRLVDRNPEVGEYGTALASLYMNLARGQQPLDALASLEQAHAILSNLVTQYPENRQFRRDLAAATREVGGSQLQLGQLELARQNIRESIEQLEKLIREDPANQDFSDQLQKSRDALDRANAANAVRAA